MITALPSRISRPCPGKTQELLWTIANLVCLTAKVVRTIAILVYENANLVCAILNSVCAKAKLVCSIANLVCEIAKLVCVSASKACPLNSPLPGEGKILPQDAITRAFRHISFSLMQPPATPTPEEEGVRAFAKKESPKTRAPQSPAPALECGASGSSQRSCGVWSSAFRLRRGFGAARVCAQDFGEWVSPPELR